MSQSGRERQRDREMTISLSKGVDPPSLDAALRHGEPPRSKTPPSIEELVDRYGGVVFAYAMRLSGNANDAEDLVQQTFLSAQRKLFQLRDPSRSRSWLLAIVRNTFRKSCRRRTPAIASVVAVDLAQVPCESTTTPPSVVDGVALQAALSRLSPQHRMMLGMFYFEELSYRQIAQRLNLKLGTVMSRLARAKNALRSILSHEVPDLLPPAIENDVLPEWDPGREVRK